MSRAISNVPFSSRALRSVLIAAGTLVFTSVALNAAEVEVTRTDSGTKVIASDPTSSIKIIDGTGSSSTDITVGASVTDAISITNTATGGDSTISIGSGSTLRLAADGAITIGTGASNLIIKDGTLTAGGATNTAGVVTFTNPTSGGITVGSVIADNGTGVVALNKTGGGILTLSGNNTYTGGTTIAGRVIVQHSNAFGTGDVQIGSSVGSDIVLANGVDVANKLAIGTSGGSAVAPYETYTGLLKVTDADAVAVWSGDITIHTSTTSGGHFVTTNGAKLHIKGSITSSVVVVHRNGYLILSGGGNYTGINVTDTLELGADNGVATNAKMNLGVSGDGIFTMNGFNQDLVGLSVSTNRTATITGTGTLTISATENFVLGGNTGSNHATLKMGDLSNFIFDGANNDFSVGGQVAGDGSKGILYLAQNSQITAKNIYLGSELSLANGNNALLSGTIYLGASTELKTERLMVGVKEKTSGTIQLADGLSSGTFSLQGVNAGDRVVVDIAYGGNSSYQSTVGNLDLSKVTTDALVDTLLIGRKTGGGQTVTGSLSMGAGTLDANTITLGDVSGGGAGTVAGSLSISNGGTITADTITLGAATGTGTGAITTSIEINDASTLEAKTLTIGNNTASATLSSSVILNEGATLAAQTIAAGSGTATRTFTWNGGSIKNYDTSTDLSIGTGLILALEGADVAHTFSIDAGRTGTVAASISGDGNMVKTGDGTLTLNAATYVGATRVEGGSLILNNPTLPDITRLEVLSGASIKFSDGTGHLVLNNANTSFAGRASGSGTDIDGSLTLSGGHTLNVGSTTGFETLAISQNLTLNNTTVNVQLTGLATFDKIELGGTLTADGSNTLNIDLLGATSLVAGDYTLISTGTGTLNESILGKFTLVGLDSLSLTQATLKLDATGQNLVLNIWVMRGLTWTGNNNNSWDTATTNNWWEALTSSAVTFQDADGITFDDTSTARDVTINGVVSPYMMEVNTDDTYTFTNTAAGKITGRTNLDKKGIGTLILTGEATHDFTGPVSILGGTIELSGNGPLLANGGLASMLGASGNAAANLVIAGGTLRLNGTVDTITDRNFTIGTGGATLDSAATGKLVFFTNTGTTANTGMANSTLTLAGAGDGALALGLVDPTGYTLGLNKTGAGTWTLQGSSTFTGDVFVSGGTLGVASDAALGNTTSIRLNGSTLTNASTTTAIADTAMDVTLSATKNITLDTLNGGTFLAQAGKTFAINGSVSGGSLTKAGAGKLTLGGDTTYTGDTLIQAGTLALANNGSLASNTITIHTGAQLDVSGVASGLTLGMGKTIMAGSDSATIDLKGTYTLAGGTLSLENVLDPGVGKLLTIDGSLKITAASDLNYILSDSIIGDNSQIKVGALDLSATTNLNAQLTAGILSTGSYTIFEYTSLTGNVSNLVYTNSLDARYVLTFKDDTANKRVLMEVQSTSSDNPLTWVGDQSGGEWSTIVTNFIQEGLGSVAYFPGDFAIFDDTAANFDIVMGTNGVILGRATFNNSTHDYTIDGVGSIRGNGYIEKRGSGKLTINTANDYAGKINDDGTRSAGTILVAGTIAVGNDLALGTGSVYIYGGTLQSAGSYTLANDIALNNGASTTFDSGTGLLGLSGTLTGNASTLITKIGAGTLSFSGDGSAYQGTIQHSQGDVTLSSTNQSSAKYQLTGTGTTLTVDAGTSQIGSLTGESGTLLKGTGTLQVGALNTNTLYAGDMTDAVGLTKVGTGALVLTGHSSNTGEIKVQGGLLQVGNDTDSSLGAGAITIDSGATLAFYTTGDLALGQLITSQGTLEKKGSNTLALSQDNTGMAGTVRISSGTLALTGTGTLGIADIVNNAALVLNRTGDYTLGNTITGQGTLTKQDAGTLTYLGSNTATGATTINSGTLQLGDNTTVSEQTYASTIALATGTDLQLAPADGGITTLSTVTGTGTVNQTGDGTSILTGTLQATQVGVTAGTLQLGSGSEKTALDVTAPVSLGTNGTLLVSRTGDTRLSGQLTGDGNLVLQGDQNGSGTLVIANATNQLTGSVSIQKKSILQVGDASTQGTLNASGNVLTVDIGQRATLLFTNAGTETGADLVLTGTGTLDYNGDSILRFNSDTTAFAGTIQASHGTMLLDAAQLPTATLNAVDTGHLQVQADADTTLTSTWGSGNGTIQLAAANASQPVTYQIDSASTFGGTLAMADHTTLQLAGHTVGAKTLALQSGALLRGNGTIQGDLHNQLGGTVHPGNSVGQINITGNFLNDGKVILDVDSAESHSTIHYSGTAQLNTSGALQMVLTQDTYDALALGTELKILVDDNTADGLSSIVGNFDLSKVTLLVDGTTLNGKALTYNKGDGGLTLLLASSIRDIPSLSLHDGLSGYVDYLDNILHNPTDHPEQVGTVSGFLGAADISGAINNASPIGLASMTAMTTAIAHDDAETLRAHLESLRYQRGEYGQEINTMPYIVGTGFFLKNGSGNSDPAFDFNTYGGLIGVDQSFGSDLLLGMNVGYHSGKADLHNGGGKVKLSNASLNFYGSYMISDWLYLDASLFGGYNSYEVKQDTMYGRATAKPEGFNYGGTAYLGTIIPLSKQFHLTPYAGFEYVRSDVDAFTEKGTQSALHLDSFTQDSLRAKIGTGLNWLVPTNADFTLRLGLNAAFAHELLDDEVDMEARFANDTSGNKYKVGTAASPENLVQVGPVVEFGFNENMSLSLGYTFEYDFDEQTAHHLNATFRMRF